MQITIIGLSKTIQDAIESDYSSFIKKSTGNMITFNSDVATLTTLSDSIEVSFDGYDHLYDFRIPHCDYWRIEIE